MVKKGLDKFFIGFIFIMLSFTVKGFDIFPDVIGYIFFAFGFRDLILRSEYFKVASKYNIAMIVLSILSLYKMPTQGEGFHIDYLGILGIVIWIASLVINLLVVYNLFKGIQDISYSQEQYELARESQIKWKHYLFLQISIWAAFILLLIPVIALIYVFIIFVISIIVTIDILRFLKRCSRELN
jgi:hypothetical protein